VPLDHYQPAAFIGGFSQDVQPRSRDRAGWVARRGVRGPYRRRAAKVAAKRNLYPARIDAIWRQSEALLPEAIAVLADGPGGIDERALYLWHRSLVPFLAGLFVRGPEFHERYHARFGDELRTVMSEHFGGPNASTDIARIVERQRACLPR